ncbi:hypothetical protein ACJX0J_015788, partial [Zea mays]
MRKVVSILYQELVVSLFDTILNLNHTISSKFNQENDPFPEKLENLQSNQLKNLLDRTHFLIYNFSDSTSLELSCGTLGGMVTTRVGLLHFIDPFSFYDENGIRRFKCDIMQVDDDNAQLLKLKIIWGYEDWDDRGQQAPFALQTRARTIDARLDNLFIKFLGKMAVVGQPLEDEELSLLFDENFVPSQKKLLPLYEYHIVEKIVITINCVHNSQASISDNLSVSEALIF